MEEEQRTVKSRDLETDKSDYAILWNRWLLMPFGVWPLENNARKSDRIARIIRRIVTICLLFIYMMPQFLYIITNPSVDGFLQVIAAQIFNVLAVVQFVVLMINDDKIGYCIECVKKSWTEVKQKEDRETMMEVAKFGRYMTVSCVGCCYSGVLFYTVVLPFINDGSDPANETVTRVERTSLPYLITYIFADKQSTPFYEITWAIQVVGSSCTCVLSCGVYALTGTLVVHICGQLRTIGLRLEDLVDGNRGEFLSVAQRMADIIERHVDAVRYVECIQRSLQVLFLTEEVGAVIVICFSGYSVITNWNKYHSALRLAVMGIILIAVIFNLFIFSIVGQWLLDESQEVGNATARVQWYRLQPKIARSLTLCMVRSAQPLKLSACSMFDMSLTNFGDVLRGAYLFLSMVRNQAEGVGRET